MLHKSFIGIDDGERTNRRLFSMRLEPIINLSGQEKIIIFDYHNQIYLLLQKDKEGSQK